MSEDSLRGQVLIAGDIPKRPSSEHRYTRPVKHGAVEYGMRNRNQSKALAPQKSARSRIAATGKSVVSNADPATHSARLSARSSARSARSVPESPGYMDQTGPATARVQTTLIQRFIAKNANVIEKLDPKLSDLPVPAQVEKLKESCQRDYQGNFVKFMNDLQADEFDLRLKSSFQVGETIGPNPPYMVAQSVQLDGYQTARAKQEERLTRMLMSARSKEPDPDAGMHNRTRGTIPEYGNFSNWTKYTQLNASAMMNR
mmetsp:Transcript_24789/g.55830  ORF Transcript_24789/g.55830 Transcript_24789/m.55830 type:complete len:258 (+) Transcript_24789:84-857(+)